MARVNMRRQAVPKDYMVYRLNQAQFFGAIIVFAAIGFALGMVFYKNTTISLVFALMGLFGPRIFRSHLINKRRKALSLQFRDLLHSMGASIGSGMQLSNAVRHAAGDLSNLYFDDDTLILLETRGMISRMDRGAAVSDVLQDLAVRSHDDDIQAFANVISGTEGGGIDMSRLIKRTVGVISEKIEVKQEIETSVAAMKSEQKIMCCMPVLLVFIINLVAPDYMAALYDAGPVGYLLITVSLVLLIGAVLLSNKFMNIKI